MHMTLPAKVRIVEVGPRDGLQNEPKYLPTDHKINLVRRLADWRDKPLGSAAWQIALSGNIRKMTECGATERRELA